MGRRFAFQSSMRTFAHLLSILMIFFSVPSMALDPYVIFGPDWQPPKDQAVNLLEGTQYDIETAQAGHVYTIDNESPENIARNAEKSKIVKRLSEYDASQKRLQIIIDKAPVPQPRPTDTTAQTAQVYLDGHFIMWFLVSTGREQKEYPPNAGSYFSDTPEGSYAISWMSKNHKSGQWGGVKMPYSVFFHRGIALHAGVGKGLKTLGYRASGGCVRQSLEDARTVWNLIKQVGKDNVSITVYDSSKRDALEVPGISDDWIFDGIY